MKIYKYVNIYRKHRGLKWLALVLKIIFMLKLSKRDLGYRYLEFTSICIRYKDDRDNIY